jgi:molybdopterin-guanine dinucleotide biosynthesis protein A
MNLKSTPAPVNGYILAGGKSSRMGQDKGLAYLNERSLIEYVIEAVRPAVQQLILVSNNPMYEKFGLEVIGDVSRFRGPAGGIQSALSHTNTKYNFITACDTPFVTTEAARYLIKLAGNADITLPIHRNRIQPLFGVYNKGCLAKWESLMNVGIVKMRDMIPSFKLCLIDTEVNELFGEDHFININTKEDLEEISKVFTHEN